MIVTIYFEVDHKKTGFGPKNSIFGPQKGHFGQLGPQNGPPSGQTGTYRKTEGIQSYLRIWRSCHPIESGPSEPKKGWFHRCSVKNAEFRAKNAVFWPKIHFFAKSVQLFCYHHDRTTKRQHFCVDPVARRASGRPPGPDFGPKICIFLRYAYITPIFLGRTDPTQWDHKSPIS